MSTEKVSLEDEARSMTVTELNASARWADQMTDPDAVSRRHAIELLSGIPTSDRARSFTARRVDAIRLEVQRRINGGQRDPVAVAKMQRVLGGQS